MEETWEQYLAKMHWDSKPPNYRPEEWAEKLARERRFWEKQKKLEEESSHFTISFRKRTKETRWTRYRAKVLESLGLSDDEISVLKYNRLTNLRIHWFLGEIRKEVERIRQKYNLPSYEAAARYRRDNYADLLDVHDIEYWDPYQRMGYYDDIVYSEIMMNWPWSQ